MYNIYSCSSFLDLIFICLDEAQRLLEVLQKDKIGKMLPNDHKVRLEVSWTGDNAKDCNPSDDDEYLRNFCKSFEEKMQWLIGRVVSQSKSITCNSQVMLILYM